MRVNGVNMLECYLLPSFELLSHIVKTRREPPGGKGDFLSCPNSAPSKKEKPVASIDCLRCVTACMRLSTQEYNNANSEALGCGQK